MLFKALNQNVSSSKFSKSVHVIICFIKFTINLCFELCTFTVIRISMKNIKQFFNRLLVFNIVPKKSNNMPKCPCRYFFFVNKFFANFFNWDNRNPTTILPDSRVDYLKFPPRLQSNDLFIGSY